MRANAQLKTVKMFKYSGTTPKDKNNSYTNELQAG
jgi:hypothetical protein